MHWFHEVLDDHLATAFCGRINCTTYGGSTFTAAIEQAAAADGPRTRAEINSELLDGLRSYRPLERGMQRDAVAFLLLHVLPLWTPRLFAGTWVGDLIAERERIDAIREVERAARRHFGVLSKCSSDATSAPGVGPRTRRLSRRTGCGASCWTERAGRLKTVPMAKRPDTAQQIINWMQLWFAEGEPYITPPPSALRQLLIEWPDPMRGAAEAVENALNRLVGLPFPRCVQAPPMPMIDDESKPAG